MVVGDTASDCFGLQDL